MERVMLESKDRLRENYIDFLYRHRDEILMECRQLQLRRPGDPHPWSGEVPKYQSIDPTQKYNDNEDSPLAGVISSFLSLCIQECETGADDGPGKRLSRWIGKTQELGLRLPDLVESLLNLKQIIHRFATERLYCKPLEVKYLNRTIDTLFDYSLFQLSLAFSRNGKDNLRTTLPGEDPHRDRDDRLKILTTLSHELHTPLTSIIGYADDLIESIDESGDQKNTEIREHASRILSNARYLMEIIRNSMEWSRLEIQETSLTPESFDLKECIFEVLTTLSRMLAEKGIRAVLRTPAEFPRPLQIINGPSRSC
jgi:signal transduction histidine kinase